MSCPICGNATHNLYAGSDHTIDDIVAKILNLEGQLTDWQTESRKWMDEAVAARPYVNAVRDALYLLSRTGLLEDSVLPLRPRMIPHLTTLAMVLRSLRQLSARGENEVDASTQGAAPLAPLARMQEYLARMQELAQEWRGATAQEQEQEPEAYAPPTSTPPTPAPLASVPPPQKKP